MSDLRIRTARNASIDQQLTAAIKDGRLPHGEQAKVAVALGVSQYLVSLRARELGIRKNNPNDGRRNAVRRRPRNASG